MAIFVYVKSVYVNQLMWKRFLRKKSEYCSPILSHKRCVFVSKAWRSKAAFLCVYTYVRPISCTEQLRRSSRADLCR